MYKKLIVLLLGSASLVGLSASSMAFAVTKAQGEKAVSGSKKPTGMKDDVDCNEVSDRTAPPANAAQAQSDVASPLSKGAQSAGGSRNVQPAHK